ncbi:helix-turn-helix domain-containing protein [Alienimonas californiensis]|uniref:Helix-turn-helix domain protein n=1 Tax=Alienimonas californiensis TaxID=2527989 RepID=A0A517P6T3_9PLAN|nr:helix-turn-helix domain-containing protein [Alienimonas californiensis]QDT15086.1 Helix-turn-helix domain protein [Alienimonas californiensis]
MLSPFPPVESNDPFRVLLTPREAADVLGISERKLRDVTVPHGNLPRVMVGRCVRYRPAALEAWAAGREEAAAGDD